MATTARLGIDIVARNRTTGAFASLDRTLSGVKRSLNQTKFLLAGFAGGNLLEGMMRSLVHVNKQVPEVAQSMDGLSRAWQAFALKVGESGLNAALINFANRIGGMIAGTDGLAKSIGGFMGGAVNAMAAVFEGIGRAIAFAYDNAGMLAKLFAAFAFVSIARSVIGIAAAFVGLARAVRTTGLIMAAFQSLSRANLMVFMMLAAGVAYATDSIDKLRDGIAAVWVKVKEVFPQIAETGKQFGEALGLDMSALYEDLNGLNKALGKLPPITVPATEAAAKLGKTLNKTGVQAKDAGVNIDGLTNRTSEMADAMSQAGQTIGSGLSQFIDSLIDKSASLKSAFKELIVSILRDLAKLGANSLFKSLFMGLASGGGGILSSLFSGFAGAFATGGSVPSGKWGIAGERGPEIITGPSSVFPMVPSRASESQPQKVEIVVRASDELWIGVDQRVRQGSQAAVQVAVQQSQKATRRAFPSLMAESQGRRM